VVVAPNLTVTDADNQTFVGATVKISGGFIPCDLLKATPFGSIQVAFDEDTGVLTLFGVDSVANYQKVLASVTFEHGPDDEYGSGYMGDNPTNYGQNPTRTIEWQVDDGSGLSKPVTTIVTIEAVNDAPVLLNGIIAPTDYRENGAPVVVAPNLTVTDADNQTFVGATVKITDGFIPCDNFDVTPFGNIAAHFDDETGVLTLSGVDSVANYQKVLASVTFEHGPDTEYGSGYMGDNPTNYGQNPTRTIEWQVDDGSGGLSAPMTTTITIQAINDAPVLGGVIAPTDYRENGAPVVVAPNLTVTDADNQTLVGATVKISDGFIPCDGFDVSPFGNIAAHFDDETGVLTLTGVDSVAN
jgi:hypothetical protein